MREHRRRLRLLGGTPVRLDVVDRRRIRPRQSAEAIRPRLLRRREQPPRLLVCVSREDVQPCHRVRLGELRRRSELAAIDIESCEQIRRREMRGEGVRETQRSSESGAEGARAENPERNPEIRARHGPDRLSGLDRTEEVLQILDVPRELVAARRVAPQRPRGELVGAGCAAEAEIDSTRVERLERAELLCDHEWRVVRQHDPACSDANRRGSRCEMTHDDGCRCTRDPRHVVVLGDPVAPVPEPFCVTREVEARAKGIPRRRAKRDRRQVEHGKRGRRAHCLLTVPSAPMLPVIVSDTPPTGSEW